MTIYKTQGICAKEMRFSVNEGKVVDLEIIGGCPGNLFGLTNLVKGMAVDEVIEKLEGITCGGKPTSCPDQLSKALKPYL